MVLGPLVVLAMASAVTASQFDWMVEFKNQMSHGGVQAVGFLEGLPLEQRKTSEYHWALALACKAAAKPCPAAEAVAIYKIIPHEKERDLHSLTVWLRAQSHQFLGKSGTVTAAGDAKLALKCFLAAVKCDATALNKDVSGLRATASAALEKLVTKNPRRAESQFLRAFYAVRFGENGTAIHAFEALVDLETDPYKKWRAQVWLEWLRQESREARAKDALAAAVAAGADLDDKPVSHAEPRPQESAAPVPSGRMNLHEKLQQIQASFSQ
jgi:hypothetical protein